MQAYHHPALQLPAPTVIITPHFVRAATTFDEDEQPPIPYIEHQAPGALPKKKKKTQKTKEPAGPRCATPTALGESIRQHTSTVKPVAVKSKGKGKEREESPKKGSKLVIKNIREQRYSDKRAIEEDITRKLSLSGSDTANVVATKVIKPAQELKIKEAPLLAAPAISTSSSHSSPRHS